MWPVARLTGEGLPDFSELPPSVYEEWVLAVDGTRIYSDGFSVEPCRLLECPKRLIPSAADLFKAQKTAAKIALESLCNAIIALNAAEAASDAKYYADMLVVEFGGAGLRLSRATLLRETAQDYTINFVKKLFTPTDIGKWWATGAAAVGCYPGLQEVFKEILDDPPDPEFEQVAQPEYVDLPLSGDEHADDLVRALDRLGGDSAAMLTAFERYQGADLEELSGTSMFRPSARHRRLRGARRSAGERRAPACGGGSRRGGSGSAQPGVDAGAVGDLPRGLRPHPERGVPYL